MTAGRALGVQSRRLLGPLFYLIIAACGSDTNVRESDSRGGGGAAAVAAAPLPDEQAWRAVAAKKIYFGHQSVGANILDGVRELMAADSGAPRLTIVSADDPGAVRGPALVESYVGQNGDPASKGAAFAAALERGMGEEGGVALYKHCYVDFGRGTDVRRLFADYQARMAALRAKYPKLVIAHVTVPLTTVNENPVKKLLKSALGRPTAAEANALRSEFNALLRATYAGKEPVFDLAAIESTRPDGSRAYITRGADTVYTLAPEYTDDGGHLNAAGRRAAAAGFIAFLAKL